MLETALPILIRTGIWLVAIGVVACLGLITSAVILYIKEGKEK